MVDIRMATSADADEMDQMVRELAAHEQSLDDVGVDAAAWRGLLARREVTVLLAQYGNEVIGFASVVRRLHLWSGTDVLALDDLYVRPGQRSRGIGTQLMAAVARLASREDLIVVWGIRLDNQAGQRLYARLGATISTKMSASWTPEHYRHLAACAA